MTNNDIGAADNHQEIILTNTIMGAVPPQWFTQFIAAPPLWLTQFIGNVNQNFNQIHAEMQAGFTHTEVWQVNAGISRLNRLEMENNTGLVAY